MTGAEAKELRRQIRSIVYTLEGFESWRVNPVLKLSAEKMLEEFRSRILEIVDEMEVTT